MISNMDTESSRDNNGEVWNTRRNHIGWKMYLRNDAKGTISSYAAPARQTAYQGLPPCYAFVGDGEPFYSEMLKDVEDLKAAGVEADVDICQTDVHAFDMLRPEEAIAIQARAKLMERFEYALEHYR